MSEPQYLTDEEIREGWRKATPQQYAIVLGLMTGKLTHCHACHEAVPVQSVVVIGVLDDGDERHICPDCASQERNYARTPEEECIQCGTIRKKLGSEFCSQGCEDKMRALGLWPPKGEEGAA